MALALADSLTHCGALDESDLLRRFVEWWQEGTYSCTGQCFDIGLTTEAALMRWQETQDPHAARRIPVLPATDR